MRLSELARCIGARLEGDNGACEITGIAPLDTAQQGQISFLANPQYRKLLATTKASAVILAPADRVLSSVLVLEMDNPYLGYAKAARLFDTRVISAGIHATAVMGADVQIHPSACIGPHCVIGDGVSIGAQSHLYGHVYVYPGVTIGERAIIHSGVVIGADGFGFAADDKGQWVKIPQLGGVRIGNDVEIGANTTIDRGALGDTVIGDGVKLDNQIQIGHNVQIGVHTIMAGCTAVAGSTTIGKYCRIGGRVSILGHITICDKTVITAMSGIGHSITTPGIYSGGFPAQEHRAWQKNIARFRQLDTWIRNFKK